MAHSDALLPIVNFLDHDWDRDYKHPHLEGIGAVTRLLCIEPPLTLASPLIRRRDLSQALWGSARLRQLGDTLWLYKPLALFPYAITLRFPWLAPYNRTVMKWSLRGLLKRLSLQKPILMVSHPAHHYTIGMLDECLLCYEVYDEHTVKRSHHSSVLLQQQAYIEQEILRQADIVFASAHNLAESKSRYNQNTHFVPNTADVKFFLTARDSDTVVPADLDALPHPRLGLIGHINDIVDVELINYLAENRPRWSIVLIGALNGSVAFMRSEQYLKMRRQPNVHYLGFKTYETLPAYEKGLDVCLLPYLINDYTRNVYPSKLHQYLAGGKPVVSTDLPEMRQFAEVIDIAKNHEEFLNNVEKAFKNDNAVLLEKRIEVARENSVEKRAELKVQLLKEVLNGKSQGLV